MRRRIITAIIGTTVLALVLSGLGTLLLARANAHQEAREQLAAIAPDLAENVAVSLRQSLGTARRLDDEQLPRLIGSVLLRALDLDSVELVIVEPDGRTNAPLPDIVQDAPLPDLDLGQQVTSGRDGRQVWAVGAARISPQRSLLVVMSGRARTDLGALTRWFAVASVAVLAVGTIVASRLGRRLSDPIGSVEHTTAVLAAGDMSARAQVPSSAAPEVRELASSVNTMASTLERAKGLEQQFLLSVSHDLRTPLTSIKGFAEALADGTVEGADDQRRAASIISEQALRLERLVGDLLQLARLDAREFRLDNHVIDVRPLVARSVEALARTSPGVDVRGPRPGPEALARADPDRLAQVLSNLMENGLKFAQSALEVTVDLVDDEVLVAVHDDGPGIDPADLPHVFERLYVASREPVRSESGTGLGLAIARELVQAMSGTVSADRSPLGGAALQIRLPQTARP